MGNVYVPVGTTATLLYNPGAANDRVKLVNAGQATVYLGQSAVTAVTGLPLRPGTSPIEITLLAGALYGIVAPGATGAPSGTTSAAIAAGATALPVASGGASFTQGMVVKLDTGASTEVVTVGAGSTGTSIVVSATQFAHGSGAAIATVTTSTGTSVHVVSGTG